MTDPNSPQPAAFLPYLHRLVRGEPFAARDAEAAMELILSGSVSPVQLAAFLVLLPPRQVGAEVLAGFARAMREAMVRVDPGPGPVLDTCGTGGDEANTFNISTVAAFVVAGAGVRVAKHGNRSASSMCGSADVLEALGVKIDLTPERMGASIREVGIGFLFAPLLHPALRHAAPVRSELKMRTVLNLMGPLCNPAGAQAQLIGVPSEGIGDEMAAALAELSGTTGARTGGGTAADQTGGGMAADQSGGGTAADQSGGGTAADQSGGGTAADQSGGGTAADQSGGGTAADQSGGGMAADQSGGGTAADQSGGGMAADQSGGGTAADQSGGGTAADQSGGGTAADQSGGGTAADQSGGGMAADQSGGGTAADQSGGGMAADQSGGGTAADQSGGGTAADQSGGGTAADQSGGGMAGAPGPRSGGPARIGRIEGGPGGVGGSPAEVATGRQFLVHGSDGLDEITLSGSTTVWRVENGLVRKEYWQPGDFGLGRASLDALRGGDRFANARITLAILGGEAGPKRDIVLLNAAAGLLVAGACTTFDEAIERARASIDSGAALAKLEAMAAFSKS